MAKVLSKTYDHDHGAVFLQVQDGVMGKITPRTIYVTGVEDFDAEVEALLKAVDVSAAALKAAMVKAGWVE